MRKPTQLALPFSSISLRRIDETANCRRFYAVSIETDLFGQTLLARHWGRIGTHGRSRFDEHPNEDAAQAALASLVAAKQRRGYQDRALLASEPPKAQRGGHDGHAFERSGSDEAREPPLPL